VSGTREWRTAKGGVAVDWLAATRDVIIIIVALVTLAANILLVVLGIRIWKLVQQVRAETVPILTTVSQTSDTIRGTTTVIGDVVVGPLARLAALSAAAQTLIRSLLTIGRGGRHR
jgi:hypothetical protein